MNEKDSVVFTDQNQALLERPHGEGRGGDVVRHRQVYCHHKGGGEGGEGKEEEKKKAVFWTTKSLAKKSIIFLFICCCLLCCKDKGLFLLSFLSFSIFIVVALEAGCGVWSMMWQTTRIRGKRWTRRS